MRHTFIPVPDGRVRVAENTPIGFWSVVLPIARTNLILNPSIETNTTGYTAVGGSIAQSTTRQYHGAASLAITPGAGTSDGAYYGPVSMTAGTTYAISCKVWAPAGLAYQLSVASIAAATLVTRPFQGNGHWQWIWCVWTESASVNRRIYLTKAGGANTRTIYLDGLQCEACAAGQYWPTTYIDGDQRGLLANQYPAAYSWTGTPHASTSIRSGQTRAGGQVVNLQAAYGLVGTGTIGLGLATPQHQALAFSAIDGGQYQDTIVPPRTFSILGVLDAETPAHRQRRMSALQAALGYDAAGLRQPIRLIYQPMDGYQAIGSACDVIATYDGGLEGSDSHPLRESLALTCTQYTPTITAGEAGSALTVQQSVANANYCIQRRASGAWAAMGTGVNGGIFALATGPDGTLYAGGDFTTANGSAAPYIAAWSGSAWSALGAGMNSTVYALAIGPDGALYAGGNFTTAGGGAAAYIAKWDGSTWTALGTGMNAVVRALVFGADGTLYAGGNFTTAGGGAAQRIAAWSGSAWSAVSADAISAMIYALAIGIDGTLYAGGAFTTIAAASVPRIAAWNGSAWSGLSSGADNTVQKLAVAPNGTLYAGGEFTTIGGVATTQIAAWNGVAWSGLGSGVNNTVLALRTTPAGTLMVGGAFTVAGGLTLVDGLAEWTGSMWLPLDANLPGGVASVNSLMVQADGTLTIGFNQAGTAVTAAVTSVTNLGSARTYPQIIITGPTTGTSALSHLTNTTTGRSIRLAYTIQAGETLTLTLDPANITVVSSMRGNVLGQILPGSNTAAWFLQPGANTISLYAAAATVAARLAWPVRYASLADAIW